MMQQMHFIFLNEVKVYKESWQDIYGNLVMTY